MGIRKATCFFAVCLLLGVSNLLNAQVDVFDFDTPEQEQRFRELSDSFRCPMCQNANLSNSTGGVAADLRREIHRMIMEGRTDQEIEQFMLERYGDFILYRPRLRWQTVLLWFGPLIFLALGAWITINITRRSSKAPEQSDCLSDAEEERLARLLSRQGIDSTALEDSSAQTPHGKSAEPGKS